MKKVYLYSMVALMAAANVQAQEVKNLQIERSETKVLVNMDLDLTELPATRSNAIQTVTPVLKNGENSVALKSVGVYGRTRYYYTQRNKNKNPLTANDMQMRAKDAPATVAYQDVVEWQPWMEGASLYINNKVYGCVSCLLAENSNMVYKMPEPVIEEVKEEYKPQFVYVRPEAERVKVRSLAASAYVNFRVNKTDIDRTYMSNTTELAKIIATIDEVKAGNKVTGITLKGFASPEGSYASNTRLAKGRVEAIRDYLAVQEHMPKDQIRADYEPENWEGLRKYVAESSINHKGAILDIIDSNREPDPKEAYLKAQFPAEYKQLLSDCYPSLRRTDYAINYEVKHYTDVEEIKRVFRTAPQNLSLEEFYLVAQTYESGSADFQEIFETAVRLFPEDPIANLNAANAAMEQGNLERAEKYLQKAGSRSEAQTAREILAKLKEIKASEK